MLENALLQALHAALTPSRVYTDHKTLSILAQDALHPGRMPGWAAAEETTSSATLVSLLVRQQRPHVWSVVSSWIRCAADSARTQTSC